MAWLHATPKPDKPPEARPGEVEEPRLSRAEQMKKDGIPLRMPPNPAPHIVDRLIEIGLTEAAGMGAVPLSWREINEWQRAMEIPLAPWEARLIRKLSVEYLAASRRAEKELCRPPWQAEVTQAERDAELRALRMVLD